MSSQRWLSPPQTCISIERQLQKFPTVAVSSVCGFFFFFLVGRFSGFGHYLVGPVHCLRNPQTFFSTKFSLKMSLTELFTHLKIILL